MIESRGRVTHAAQVRARQGIIRGALQGWTNSRGEDHKPFEIEELIALVRCLLSAWTRESRQPT